MLTPLINTIEQILPLTAEEKDLLAESFSPRLYRKKQYILQEGDTCHYSYFVVNGCLRMYTIDEKGNLHIISFAAENSWISSMNSFYTETPSAFAIDALEDTTLLRIHRDDLYTLYRKGSRFNRIFRVLIERAFMALEQHVVHTVSTSVAQRYEYFAQSYPQLINRLPQTQIAAYLGITPVSLSNAKADFLRGKK
ncbi:cAMP-binding protein [Capnocytophaga sp. HP1101]